MCLDIVYRGKQKKEALAKLPESGYYWKRLKRYINHYYPLIKKLPGDKPFRKGWNHTKKKYVGVSYAVAFHLHRHRRGAQSWPSGAWSSDEIVRCKVDKKDIISIGEQCGDITIVTTRFWCPKFKPYHRRKPCD